MIKDYTAVLGRLDAFIASQETDISRSSIQNLIKEGNVTVNAKTIVKTSYTVQDGDDVQVAFPEKNHKTSSQDIPLEILYEDDQLLVINKPAGIIVHPNDEDERDTLVNALLHHYPEIQNAVYDPESPVSLLRPGIVHRLDKETSGALLVAKNSETLRALSTQFQEHTVRKEYLALLYGTVSKEETVQTTMRRKPSQRNMMGVSKNGEGREAITHLIPEAYFQFRKQSLTLTRCRIETGRTHQIRVHAKFRGHPVLGDSLYTNKLAQEMSKFLGATRQLLHAETLEFTQPTTGKRIIVSAPLPVDFATILTKLEAPDSLQDKGL